ncbi:MAG TPA: hypothetical protein VEH27_13615 [Methylomirabilota bacterium]|nr:hypothetical protein [Methylomirabilota bacterium]
MTEERQIADRWSLFICTKPVRSFLMAAVFGAALHAVMGMGSTFAQHFVTNRLPLHPDTVVQWAMIVATGTIVFLHVLTPSRRVFGTAVFLAASISAIVARAVAHRAMSPTPLVPPALDLYQIAQLVGGGIVGASLAYFFKRRSWILPAGVMSALAYLGGISVTRWIAVGIMDVMPYAMLFAFLGYGLVMGAWHWLLLWLLQSKVREAIQAENALNSSINTHPQGVLDRSPRVG